MRLEEEKLLHALKEFLGFVRSEAPRQVDGFSRFVSLIEEIFNDTDSSVQKKYQESRRLESIFGGMGSVNDYPWSPQAEQTKEALFQAVQNVLRIYWKELGNQVYDPTMFDLLTVGTKVRLIECKTMFINRDESVVEVTWRVAQKKWKVAAINQPDVSGMPTYVLRSGNTYQVARHESIQIEH